MAYPWSFAAYQNRHFPTTAFWDMFFDLKKADKFTSNQVRSPRSEASMKAKSILILFSFCFSYCLASLEICKETCRSTYSIHTNDQVCSVTAAFHKLWLWPGYNNRSQKRGCATCVTVVWSPWIFVALIHLNSFFELMRF